MGLSMTSRVARMVWRAIGTRAYVHSPSSKDSADSALLFADFVGQSNVRSRYKPLSNRPLLQFFANNLASQSHNLTLTTLLDQPNKWESMDLDRVVVFASNGTNSSLSNDIMSQPDLVQMTPMSKENTT